MKKKKRLNRISERSDAKEAALRKDPRFQQLNRDWPRLGILARAALVGEILNDAGTGTQRLLARLLKRHVRDESKIRLYFCVSKLAPERKEEIRLGKPMREVLKKEAQARRLATAGNSTTPAMVPVPPQPVLTERGEEPERVFEDLQAWFRNLPVPPTSGAASSLMRSLRLRLEHDSKQALYDSELENKLLTWLSERVPDRELRLDVVRLAERLYRKSYVQAGWSTPAPPYSPAKRRPREYQDGRMDEGRPKSFPTFHRG